MGTEVVEGPITSSSSLLPLFVAEIGIVVIPIIPRRCDPPSGVPPRVIHPRNVLNLGAKQREKGERGGVAGERAGDVGEARQRSPKEEDGRGLGEGKKGGFASGGRKGERRHQTRVKGSTKIIPPPSKWPCEPSSCILKWNPRVVLYTLPSNSHLPTSATSLSSSLPSFLPFFLSWFLLFFSFHSFLFFSSRKVLHLPLPLRLSSRPVRRCFSRSK